MKEIELIINDENIDGVYGMGFVEYPAIEEDFIYFKNEKENYTFGKLDEEQGIIVSPALIPDKKIYRFDPYTNEEYYVYFTKETIRKLAEGFLLNNKQNNVTEQHENPINGIKLIFSWIVENEHDPIITKYGYNVPVGTWVVSYKIENEDVKKKIKEGQINGISIEGWLSNKLDNSLVDKDKELVEKIIDIVKNV